ncbi:MAG: DUF624 domain-containing protein [Ruminococcaceae bacterium]|nr:DUF624 domain-containing protein [Oscillospiraceae bacterium]
MALPKFFNPAKEGPGVSKNAPQKKRFFLFWELYFRKFFKLIQANFIYILFSLPIVTVGLAEVGLTYITRNYAREKHAFIWGDFVDTIKKNWRQALPIGFINALAMGVLAFDVYFYLNVETTSNITQVVMCAFAMLLFLVCAFMRYYIPLMIITFKLNWKQLYKNALIFSFVAIFRNLLITAVLAIFYILAIASYLSLAQGAFIPAVIMGAVYLLFFPAFRSFLIQFTIFPKVQELMINPYYRDHPNEDHAQKQALNIPDAEGARLAEEEAVFVDRGRTDSYLNEEKKEKLPPMPKQYTEREMRRFNEARRRAEGNDDDDTI